jgi:hypothetical protein
MNMVTKSNKTDTPSVMKRKGSYEVERLFKDGLLSGEIAEKTGWTEKAVISFLCNEAMLQRLNHDLSRRLFLFQVQTILFRFKTLDALQDRALKAIEEGKPEKMLTLLLKMTRDKTIPSIINPKNFSVIEGIAKEPAMSLEDVERSFG